MKVEVNGTDFLTEFDSKFKITCKCCGSDRVSIVADSDNEPVHDVTYPVYTNAYLRVECCDCTNNLEGYEQTIDEDVKK